MKAETKNAIPAAVKVKAEEALQQLIPSISKDRYILLSPEERIEMKISGYYVLWIISMSNKGYLLTKKCLEGI
ncbi:hypothetical protein C0J52_03087 [Blattella germanica]|nr:hypothetical protein C0J52_03087 [Blattella germanica]